MANLNPEIKKEWVALLRSGTIKQTTRALCRTDGTCCALGVLVKVLEKDGMVTIDPEPIAGGKFAIIDKASGHRGIGNLPNHTRVNIGLCDPDLGMDRSRTIMMLNDECEHSFKKIANYIEANL